MFMTNWRSQPCHSRYGFLLILLTGVAACASPPPADSDEPLGVVRQAVDPVPDLTTYIGQKWTKLGGAAVVGDAIAEVKPAPMADGEYQEFQNGVIVYTNDYGAVYMSGPIFERWQANGYKKVGAPAEDMVHDSLPLVSEGHTRATFDQGLIIHNDGSSDVFVVERRAAQEYLRDCVEVPLNCRHLCPVSENSAGFSGCAAGLPCVTICDHTFFVSPLWKTSAIMSSVQKIAKSRTI